MACRFGWLIGAWLMLALVGCEDEPMEQVDAGSDAATEASVPDAGDEDAAAGDAGDAGVTFGGLVPNTPYGSFEIDLFATTGHRFWVEVSARELARMNEQGGSGGPGPIFAREFEIDNGELYTPGTGATWADHVVVKNATSSAVADFGKVEVKLVGESTYRPWNTTSIPNVRFDFDEFELGKRLGSFEHLRLNNAMVGTIFREALAHRIYRALGYPALRSTHAFLGSNVWGSDVWVPMTLMEVYKPRFCEDNADLLDGGCRNMWEFPGDPGDMVPPSACQWAECDDTRLKDFRAEMRRIPLGPGFKANTGDFIDWDRMHEFQCLSWMLATGDDALHNANNNLIIEQNDGRLVWAPYSVDISAGQDWYPTVPLTGSSRVARGCQLDPACWTDTLATCERLITAFDELNPEVMVEQLVTALGDAEMLREGDMERAMQLRQWYATRQEELPTLIERYRVLADVYGQCPDGLIVCQDKSCGTQDECDARQCDLQQRWCPELHACIQYDEECFTCEGEGAMFCPPSNNCELSIDVCSAFCSQNQGEGSFYCPSTHRCDFECLPDDLDGGVEWPGLDAGIIPF